MDINNLENLIKELNNEVQKTKGSLNTIESQYADSTETLDNLKNSGILNSKGVELLNFAQKATKDLIKDMFENVVTKALTFIHQNDDYKFELDFSRHGNTPKLSFRLKTPDMQEAHDIITTRSGGAKDVIALALRIVLLEISKSNGFLFLDEPYKRLDNDETIQKAIEFLQETQKETKRQIFLITHKDEVINSVENPIIIKANTTAKSIVEDKPKKKRGRPKKEK